MDSIELKKHIETNWTFIPGQRLCEAYYDQQNDTIARITNHQVEVYSNRTDSNKPYDLKTFKDIKIYNMPF